MEEIRKGDLYKFGSCRQSDEFFVSFIVGIVGYSYQCKRFRVFMLKRQSMWSGGNRSSSTISFVV